MASLHWQDAPSHHSAQQHETQPPAVRQTRHWFGMTCFLLGIILGFIAGGLPQ